MPHVGDPKYRLQAASIEREREPATKMGSSSFVDVGSNLVNSWNILSIEVGIEFLHWTMIHVL